MELMVWIYVIIALAALIVLTQFKFRKVLRVEFQRPVEILGRSIPPGAYQVAWDKRGTQWSIHLLKGKTSSLTFPAQESVSRAAIDRDALALQREPDGRIKSLEIRIRPDLILHLNVTEPRVDRA